VRKTVFVSQDVGLTAKTCRDLLTTVGYERSNPANERTIEVLTPMNGKSIGTVIRAELQPAERGTTVAISAWPGAQLFDWGESKHLAQTIADRLGSSP
jgi:hypothetical protein